MAKPTPKPVTLDSIRSSLAKIKTYDSEIAHCSLDALYIDVLGAIAAGAPDAEALAAAVLKGEKLDFSRWYA